jgi:hypothetical protein
VSVCLLLIGDGRDEYRARTLASLAEMVPPCDHFVEIDDREHRLGFAGAVQAGWELVLETGARWVFHLEADFTFNRPVDLGAMGRVLEREPLLAQLVLKRQPWNEQETAAGGIVEQHPDEYLERLAGVAVWTEHRRFFSTNPSLYSAAICRRAWPQTPSSEGVFTHRLLADGYRFAFWGGKYDPPVVHHIGEARAGRGY